MINVNRLLYSIKCCNLQYCNKDIDDLLLISRFYSLLPHSVTANALHFECRDSSSILDGAAII